MATLLLLLLAACGGADTGDTTSPTDESPDAVETADEGEAGDGPTETVRLIQKFSTTHYAQELAEGIAAAVAEGTDGRYTVEIFPAEQLVPVAEEIPSVADGTVQISLTTSTSDWHDFDIPANITSLPFALSGFEQSRTLRGSEFEQRLGEHYESVANVRVLGFLEASGVDTILTTSKVLRTPDDFQGLRIRGNNEDVATLFERYGSPALAQVDSDVYTSLERGTLDGAITIVSAALARSWHEPAPYVTITPGWLGYAMFSIIANADWWDGLAEADRAVFEAAIAEAVELGQEYAEADFENGLQQLEDDPAVEVYVVPLEEQEAWSAPGEFLYERFREQWGTEGEELLELYTSTGG